MINWNGGSRKRLWSVPSRCSKICDVGHFQDRRVVGCGNITDIKTLHLPYTVV